MQRVQRVQRPKFDLGQLMELTTLLARAYPCYFSSTLSSSIIDHLSLIFLNETKELHWPGLNLPHVTGQRIVGK